MIVELNIINNRSHFIVNLTLFSEDVFGHWYKQAPDLVLISAELLFLVSYHHLQVRHLRPPVWSAEQTAVIRTSLLRSSHSSYRSARLISEDALQSDSERNLREYQMLP